MPTSPSPQPTLDYLHPIVAVEDEALILLDGTLLALLRCRSSGLALRTDDEADAMVQALKRQLLALRGLTQVVIDVAPVDVRRFLAGEPGIYRFVYRQKGALFLPYFAAMYFLVNLVIMAGLAVGVVQWLTSARFRRLYTAEPEPARVPT